MASPVLTAPAAWLLTSLFRDLGIERIEDWCRHHKAGPCSTYSWILLENARCFPLILEIIVEVVEDVLSHCYGSITYIVASPDYLVATAICNQDSYQTPRLT